MPIPAEAGIALAIGLGAAIALCAFVAGGGSQLGRTTWTEVGLMLGGAGLTAAGSDAECGLDAAAGARCRGSGA